MPKESQATIVEMKIDEYERFISEITSSCERWLAGQTDGNTLSKEFAKVKGKIVVVPEFKDKPDDFDWSTLPTKLVLEKEKLDSQFQNALRMAWASHEAVEMIESNSRLADSIANRAYCFGKCSIEYRFDPLVG